MNKIDEAKQILKAFGLPDAQQNDIAGYTLLALCNIKPNDKWGIAQRKSLKITNGIMLFVKEVYKKKYAPNTRETFRRQVLHQFVQARLVDYNPDNPNLPVNSPNAHYAISEEALKVIQAFNSKKFKSVLSIFISQVGELKKIYRRDRKHNMIPVKLSNGKLLKLSAGKHNQVQAAIIQEFASRFVKGGIIIYLGDTAKKNLYLDNTVLTKLNIPITQHSKLPDVMIYDTKKNWLFLVEAVTSHGPISPKRLIELEVLLQSSDAGKIYVTAFPNFSEFNKHSKVIAWETEVWIVDNPEHLIHFNGDKFFGPRSFQ